MVNSAYNWQLIHFQIMKNLGKFIPLFILIVLTHTAQQQQYSSVQQNFKLSGDVYSFDGQNMNNKILRTNGRPEQNTPLLKQSRLQNRNLNREKEIQQSQSFKFEALQNQIINSKPSKNYQGSQNRMVPINLDYQEISYKSKRIMLDNAVEQPKQTINQVQKPILGKGLKGNDGLSYQRIHIGELNKKFLFIDLKLAEKDQWQKVKIDVYLEYNGTYTTIKQCQYDGHDSCYLQTQKLTKDSVLLIVLKCQDECTYNLNSHWSDLQHLIPGNSYVFAFGKQTSQLYHVELTDKKFQEFRVHVAPRTTRRPFDNIKIYGKYGSDTGLTTQNYDFQSFNLWQDGQGIFLSPKDIKSLNFDLLLVGQTQSTYKIFCQLIQQSNHQIQNGQHIYQYLRAGESKTYKISNFDTKRFEQFSLKVSVLTGKVQVQYFYDEKLTRRLPYEPYKYMEDSQYIFQAQQAQQFAKTGVYLKITSKGQGEKTARDATFTINFESRQKSDAIQLLQHVYGFVSIKQAKFAFFNFKRWLQQTQTNLKFTVSALQVLGNSKLEFFICKDKLHTCTDPQKYKKTTDPVPQGQKIQEEISQKQRYQFQFSDSYLKQINNLEEEGIIVVRITNAAEKGEVSSYGFNLVALEFINNNKVLILREGRPLQDKLMANELKIYKYINSDQNVKEIRIHVNEIAGIIKLSGLIKNPFNQKTIAVQPEGTTLRFVNNLTQPIIVSVRAQSKAIFGISMQIILKNDEAGLADVRAIGEDLAYIIRINPNSFTIFEITPIFYEFLFKYESTQTIIACALNMTSGDCLNMNSSINNVFTEKGEITNAQLSKERKARVKIANPFSDSVAEVTVIFHSRSFDHCDQKKVSKAYSQNVRNGTCYSYLLQGEQASGLQLYISKRELANMTYSVLVCGNSITDAYKLKTLTLSNQLINQKCNKKLQSKKIDIYWYVNTDNIDLRDYNVKVDFVVQKVGGVVILPEGLSYSVLTKAREGIIKNFGYSLINKIDARVFIHQNIGKFKAFAKVINEDDRDTEEVSLMNSHASSTTTNNYEQQPVIVITKKTIEQSRCVRCFLLIAVYTETQQGRTIQFQIEVVQKYQNLNDDSSIKGYLQAGSFAYYTYRAKEAKETSLIFFLSDHHQKCANMYLALNQNPGPKFNIAKAFEANQLVHTHRGGETKYFLAVQAKSTCDYALSVLQIDTSIQRLERGKQNMIKLLKGEVRYFTFQQYVQEPFKILSLSKFGEVRLHLNISGILTNKRTFSTQQLNLKKFAVKSQNPNVLTVSTSDKIYCKDCSYFLAAQAVSTTFATLFLVYPQTIVPLLKNKFFADYFLKKNDTTLASYNSLQKSKLQVVVHSGSIEITANYKEYTSSMTFNAKSDIQTMEINISEDIKRNNLNDNKALPQNVDPYFYTMKAEQKQEKIPVNFYIKALSDQSSYTLQVKQVSTKGDLSGFAQYQNIRAGEPNHVQITNDRVLCIDGVLRDAEEQIFITTSTDNREKLGQLIFNGKLRGIQTARIKKQTLKNVISIKLIDQNPDKQNNYIFNSYQLCMKYDTPIQIEKDSQKQSQKEKENIVKQKTVQTSVFQQQEEVQSFKVVITQTNSVNILPSDTQTLVKGNNAFVIHSDGEFILDVFECKGNARVSYSDSLASLQNSKSKLLESVSISQQKHAVKVTKKEVTFINVTSPHALIRWLPLNLDTDQGSGYIKFQAGDVKYSSKFKQIYIQYQPLQLKKKTKSKVNQVSYTLFVTNDSEKLQYASQCSFINENEVFQILLKSLSNRLNNGLEKEYLSFTLPKYLLEDKFKGSENIYFTIVAKLVLQVSKSVQKSEKFMTSITDDHEHYRFIYSRQQMPLEAYKPNQIESIPYVFLGLIVASVLLILGVITYILTRKVFPWIAKIRSSHLVQQQDQAPKDDLEMVPPSSDRNQIAPATIQTQDKM